MKQEIDEELRFHMEMRTAENIAVGMSPEEAARIARKRFGNVQTVREECRDVRGASFGDTLMQDVRFGARMLRKNPGFTAIAILTLALGIGANTAIFSLLNATLIKQLGYRDPDRLVLLSHQYPKLFKESQITVISPRGYFSYRSEVDSIEDIAAAKVWFSNIAGDGVPEAIEVMKVTANFFPLLGVAPAIGRNFTADEEQVGADRVVMLSHRLWQRRFAGDPNILGKTVMLDGNNYEVIGVLPANFTFIQNAEIWMPLSFRPEQKTDRGEHILAPARLKPGVTLHQVKAELDAVIKPFRDQSDYLRENQWHVQVKPFKEYLVQEIRPTLLILMGAVVLVLLIACVNIANLQLARGVGRQKEMAIRMALGASRMNLIRQILTENVLLALVGCGFGLIVVFWSLKAMTAMLPPQMLQAAQFTAGPEGIPMDVGALMFTLAASIFTGLLFGVAPAVQAFRSPVNSALKESGQGTGTSVRHRRVRGLLAGTQVALALILLTGAGLLLKSFVQLMRVDAGFNPEQLLSLRVFLTETKYDTREKLLEFHRKLLERTRALPGVKSAAFVFNLPLAPSATTTFKIEGHTEVPHGCPTSITPGYFQTMQIPLLKGRDFNSSDTANSLPVAIIDDKLAKQYWPNDDPIGKRITTGIDDDDDQPLWREIVGVVGQVKNYGLDIEAKAQYYFPSSQASSDSDSGSVLLLRVQHLVVRTDGDPNALIESVRKAVLAIDPHQPITDVKTMRARLDESLKHRRTPMLLVGLFAAVALTLAIIGLYGVMAYTTSQRTREFAIRLALGADRKHVIRLALRQGMIVVGIGVIAGLFGAWALSRLMANLLVGVSATDPFIFIGVSLLLTAIALLACYVPARRAAKVDPMTALRCE